MKTIIRGNIVLPDLMIEQGQITITNGKISYIGEPVDDSEVASSEIHHHRDGYIWPGLIDLHVHGAGGADVMDGSGEALSTIAKTLLANGVTGFLATTVTGSKERLRQVLGTIARKKRMDGEAEILGIHLEGPWICPQYKGAQNPDFIQPPIIGDGTWAYDASQGKLKIVTLAPEEPNAFDIIEELVSLGVIVSLGHTNATYEDVVQAVKRGASHITHIYNAMRGLHHREPGVVGAALNLDELFCELIADGFHVHPKACQLVVRVKGTDKTLLISDGMRAVDMPDGEYDLGGLLVTTKNGKATLHDGTLAGSLLTLNRAVLNISRYADIPIWDAVKMASLNQAKRLGLDHEIGSIEVGKRANLVAVDPQGNVQSVWVDGMLQFSRR